KGAAAGITTEVLEGPEAAGEGPRVAPDGIGVVPADLGELRHHRGGRDHIILGAVGIVAGTVHIEIAGAAAAAAFVGIFGVAVLISAGVIGGKYVAGGRAGHIEHGFAVAGGNGYGSPGIISAVVRDYLVQIAGD